MIIEIDSIKDSGNLEKERVIFKVIENGDLGKYMVAQSITINDTSFSSKLQNSDGVLVFKTSSNDYLSWASTEDNVMRLSFYSDSSNTFTFSGKGPGAENISGTFLKSGNIHYLNTELFTKVQSAVLGSLQMKVPLSIMMNGTVIQKYSITE